MDLRMDPINCHIELMKYWEKQMDIDKHFSNHPSVEIISN